MATSKVRPVVAMVNFIGLILFHSTFFTLISIGFQCPLGGYKNIQKQFGPGCMYRCHCVDDVQCDNNTGQCPGGCAAQWMGPGCQYGDIAYQKTAWQMSNRFSYTGPEKAVDGNTSSCSETNQTGAKWWRVDLNAVYKITGLVIYSSEPDALKYFEVRVGNISSNSSTDFPSICFNHSGNENISEVTHVLCTSELVGKHLMIRTPGLQTIMKMCDVRIYGGRSVAYGRFSNQSSEAWVGPASRAVDGGTSTLYNDYTCTHTREEQSPWWMVDLGKVYNILRIQIFNRNDPCCAERLSGFSVSFATSSNFSLVFNYPEETPMAITEVTTLSEDLAQRVEIRLKNKTQALTLCEVFVFGDCQNNVCGWTCDTYCHCEGPSDKHSKIYASCPGGCKTGWWGFSCNNTCDTNCRNKTCNQSDGHCSECFLGKWGRFCENNCTNCQTGTGCGNSNGICTLGCLTGWWGYSCNNTCDTNCKDNTCNQSNGHCFQCFLGKWGQICENNCTNCLNGTGCGNSNGICTVGCLTGLYGVNCSEHCRHCAIDGSCNRSTGACSHGCQPGWQEENCTIVCPSGLFGENCGTKCGHCANNSSCHHVIGTCMNGCSPGYIESTCDRECKDGFYGYNCSQKCGFCFNDTFCEHVDGTCGVECEPGFTGSKCETECPNGTFGLNCSIACGHCADYLACHHINGTCMNGCLPGYNDTMCTTMCPSGLFGKNCVKKCGHCVNNSSCHHVNGTCMDGCSPGYNESTCDQACPSGWFGENCGQECGHCASNSSCHHVNGTCIEGCSPGYTESTCDQVSKAEQKQNDSEEKMASIGGAVGGAVILILIAIGLVLWRRRRLSLANKHQERIPERNKMTSADKLNIYENVSSLNQDVMMDVRKPVSDLTHGAQENKVQVKFTTIEKEPQNKQKLELAGKEEDIIFSTSPDNVGYISSDEQSEKTICDAHGVYYNLEEKRILVENLKDYVKKTVHLSTDCEQEYRKLVSGPQYDMNIALKPSNRPKNRYKGIYAYDNTRVVLDTLPQEPESDYINACFINGYKRDKAYIAAQGPTTTIVNDFWRMIWQYNISTIVMLTGLYEQGKQKCLQYWPSEGSMEFGTLLVEIVDEEIYTEYTIRFLKVNQTDFSTQKIVTQFHFTAWPDKDVPESPTTLVQFWNKVRNMGTPTDNSPTLVHCSAGIGRTGTYIALDYLYNEGQSAGSIDVFNCINGLRRQRVGMVQNEEQYVYLHEVLVEALLISGKRVDINDFPKYYQQMREFDRTKQSKLRVEFENLQKDEEFLYEKATSKTSKDPIYEKAYEYECARLPENRMKNRYDNIIPSRKYCPFLSSYVPGRNNYINAVVLPTLKNKNGLLLTQMPLPDTVVDFWNLAFEYEVQTLVMLNEENMPGEKIGIYWPNEDQISQFGPFTVTKVSEIMAGTHVERMFYVSREGQGSILNVKQFAFSVWKLRNAIPESCSQFLSFLQEVDSWQGGSEHRPMIVHCLNGAEQSGLFCVLLCVLDRVKADREVAIRSVVRQMRVRRQHIIPNFEQYQFCHDIILEYLTNFVIYTNL